MKTKQISIKHILLALLVVTLWGTSFAVIKLGLNHLPPLLFSALRFTAAAIPAVFFVPFPREYWKQVLAIGLFLGVLKFSFLFLALKGQISASLASVLLQSQVFFTVILCYVFLSEKIQKQQLLGIVISVLGFILLFVFGDGTFTLLGLIMIACAGLFWACSNVIMKSMQNINLLQVMVWVCLIPPVPLFVLSYFIETQQPLSLLATISLNGWLSIVFLAYCSTLLAYAIWGSLLRNYTAIMITPFALLIPVVGILASDFLLGEELNNIEIISASIIMLGLIFSVFGQSIIRKVKKHSTMYE